MKQKEIDIKEDINHQKLAWKIRKTGFIIIFILVVTALSGLFGSGFISTAEKEINDQMKISYERFIRAGGPAEVNLELTNNNDSVISFLINNSYTKRIKIEKIFPSPESETAGSNFTELKFKVNSGNKKSKIKISYTGKAAGLFKAVVIYNDHSFSFNQLIYP